MTDMTLKMLVSSALLIVSIFMGVALCENDGDNNNKKIFCYYSSDSQYRKYPGKFLPRNIEASYCTHIIYAFVGVENNRLKPLNWNDQGPRGLYKKTLAHKAYNPGLKVLLAVGGWVADYEPFKEAVSTESKMEEFASNVIEYLRANSMDGLDMDWEFPGMRGSPQEDKQKFTIFLKIIQEAFKSESTRTGKPKLLLTMASAVGEDFINAAYEANRIHKYVDYMLLMTYNFHGGWGNFTGHHSAILAHSSDTGLDQNLCQAWAVNFWLNQGVPKKKMILGMVTYGMSFTLENPSDNGVNAPVYGNGIPGRYSNQPGVLAYYEICDILRNPKAKQVWLEGQQVPYVTWDDQWVGYDNARSVKIKVETLIHGLDLAGAFIWSVDLDDFNNNCGTGSLLSAIYKALHDTPQNKVKGTIYPSSVCKNLGQGLHADVTSCHRYLYCLQDGNGVYAQYTYWCPAGLSFDNSTSYCVNKFNCI